jgi:hypothetical protein
VITADLTEPLIGGLATVLVAVVGGLVTLLAPDFKRRRDQRRDAKELEARYRRSLFTAANDLQSRLYNIAEQDFLVYWHQDRFYAETSTLWLIGQYLGWVEIFRREAALVLSGVRRGNELLGRIDDISGIFATDRREYGALRVFRARQSAIAEVMISEEGRGTQRVKCLGYATFVKGLKDKDFERWFSHLRDGLETMAEAGISTPNGMAGNKRVVMLQHALMDLMAFLDPEAVTQRKLARVTVADPVSTPGT